MLSAFASIVEAREPLDIDMALAGIADPVGQFYRFGLAASPLRGGRHGVAARDDGMEAGPVEPAESDAGRELVAGAAR
jgi:hypothetical protein